MRFFELASPAASCCGSAPLRSMRPLVVSGSSHPAILSSCKAASRPLRRSLRLCEKSSAVSATHNLFHRRFFVYLSSKLLYSSMRSDGQSGYISVLRGAKKKMISRGPIKKWLGALFAAFLFLSNVQLSHAGFTSDSTDANASPEAAEFAAATTSEILLDQHRLINVVDDVLNFWSQAKGKTLPRARRLWIRMVEAKHRDYFDRSVYRNALFDERREMLDQFLISLPDRIDSIRQFNKLLQAPETNPVVAGVLDFKARFPEFRVQRDIYIGVSLLRFDGSVRAVGNTDGYPDTLCLAADVLSGYSPEQFQIVMAHELFHLYQFGFLFKREILPLRMGLFVRQIPLSSLATAHAPLMIEGMAVAASEAVYPNRPRESYLHFSEEDLAQQQSELMRNGQQYLLLMTSGAGPDQYEQWFSNSSNESIPPRGGYLLGYEAVKRMLTRFTFEEMARMNPSQLREHAEELIGIIATDWVMLVAAN